MKIVRVLFAVSLALLAAAPIYAAVPMPPPPKPSADGGRDAWRSRSIATCVAAVGEADGVTPGDAEANCGCAVDELAAGRRGEALPTLAPGAPEIRASLALCAARRHTADAVSVARQLMNGSAPGDPPPVSTLTDSKPVETPATAPADPDGPKRSGPDFQTWLDSLSLPGWISDSGLPLWAWVLLVLVVFMVLRGLLQRGDRTDLRGGRSDLIGPPPHMRLGARANPPAPPRADPPQRG